MTPLKGNLNTIEPKMAFILRGPIFFYQKLFSFWTTFLQICCR